MTTQEESASSAFYPSMGTQADRGVQEFRLDVSQLTRDLRATLTGKQYVNGAWVNVRSKGLMCVNHWEDYSVSLFPINKSMMLSKLNEEVAERLTVNFGNRLAAWLCENCLFCPDCNANGNYGNISLVVESCTIQFYVNLCRAVNGFEAEKLSTMQSVTTQESYNSDNHRRPWTLLRGGGRS